MAAFLAKRHAVTRVVLWSGPADYVLATRSVAPWLSAPSATPSDRWYGVVHRDEAGVRMLLTAYKTLGIPGSPVAADTPVPPSGSHQFVVTLAPRPPRRCCRRSRARPTAASLRIRGRRSTPTGGRCMLRCGER